MPDEASNPKPRVAWDAIARLAEPLDFGLFGIADAEPSDADRADFFRQWIADGRHGEMAYLAEHLEMRLDVRALLPGAASVIVVAEAYGNTEAGELTNAGRVARYAWGRDYHKVLKAKLHRLCDALRSAYPDEKFRATVDTAPIHEREHAARAGLGWIGKNTLLIHPRHGSFVLLGCVVTTLPIQSSRAAGHPATTVEPTDRCANCTRCIDACPTDAIAAEGYSLDATRCVSYLTLEHRSPIKSELADRLDGWIAGCDVCQDVCPYNAAGARNPLPVPLDFKPQPHAEGLNPEDVEAWDETDRLRDTAGTALTRIKLPMWRRNAEALSSTNRLSSATQVMQDPADLGECEDTHTDGHAEPEDQR